MTLYDGNNASKTNIIAHLSGNLGEFVHSSSGNALFVEFTSDESYYVGGGFHANIQYYAGQFLGIYGGFFSSIFEHFFELFKCVPLESYIFVTNVA